MPVFFYILLIHSLHFYYRLFLVAGAVCCLCDLDVLTFSETIPFYSPTPCFFILYFILFSCSVVYRSSIILPSLHSLHLCRCVTLISGLRTRTEAAAQWQSDMGEQHKHPSKLFSFFFCLFYFYVSEGWERPRHIDTAMRTSDWGFGVNMPKEAVGARSFH